MNRRLVLVFGFAATGVFAVARDAAAQNLLMPRMGGYSAAQSSEVVSNPAINPYLLMTDVGQTGVLNYLTLVQPIMQQRQATLQQNSSIHRLQQQVQDVQSNPYASNKTGHKTQRLNYSHYYPTANPY